MKKLVGTLVAAGKDWVEDKAPRLAAALSYYTAFALPPLLVLLVGIAGLVFDTAIVRERVVGQLGGLMGHDAARLLDDSISEAQLTTGSLGAVAIGSVVLLFGAAGVFGQLQSALNTVWEVETPRRRGVWGLVRSRLLSFGAVVGSGFLLLVSLAVSTAVGALVDSFSRYEALAPFLAAIDLTVSLAVVTVLFALIFKVLPDVAVKWQDVWLGALVTALLFVAGKFAIGLYLGTSDVGSAYGAAGSLIVILVWIYYSALILLYGAEFTEAWARQSGGAPGEVDPPQTATHHDPDDHESREAAQKPSGMAIFGAVVVGWLISRKMRKGGSKRG